MNQVKSLKGKIGFACGLSTVLLFMLFIHASAFYCEMNNVSPSAEGMFCWLENDPTKPENINK